MPLDAAHRHALRGLRALLENSGIRELLARYGAEEDRADARSLDAAPLAEPLQTLARLFICGEPVDRSRFQQHLSNDVADALVEPGVVQQRGEMVIPGDFRLVDHLGMFLFCQKYSPSARLYYGNDSLALSRLLLGAEGRVLDLCCGAGAQALTCARTAAFVTAVDIEPLAEKVFCVNAELNGFGDKVEFLLGDVLEPARGRRFDVMCSNPPFLPVPPGVTLPLFADGGPDGLAIVRRLLAGFPEFLEPEGRCYIAGSVLGTSDGPDLSPFESSAVEAGLKITISCLTCEELDETMLETYTANVVAAACEGDTRPVFRGHFEALGVTHLYCFLLNAGRSPQPGVHVLHHGGQAASVSIRRA